MSRKPVSPTDHVAHEPCASPALGSEIGEPAIQVLRQFRQLFNAVKTHFQQVEKSAGVGGAQLWALSIIGAHPGIGVSVLARAMDVHQSTASNLVKSLVERHFIVASKAGMDRRAVQLTILAAGQQVLARAPGPFAGVLPQALASMDPSVLQRLNADLAALIVRQRLGPEKQVTMEIQGADVHGQGRGNGGNQTRFLRLQTREDDRRQYRDIHRVTDVVFKRRYVQQGRQAAITVQ